MDGNESKDGGYVLSLSSMNLWDGHHVQKKKTERKLKTGEKKNRKEFSKAKFCQYG